MRLYTDEKFFVYHGDVRRTCYFKLPSPCVLCSYPLMAQPTVLDYLHQLQKKGMTHVSVDSEAREQLRAFYREAREAKNAPQKPIAAKKPASPSQKIPVAAPTTTQPVAAPAEKLIPQTGSAHDKIAALRTQAATWPAARQLASLRDELVFSDGSPEARVMLIGEAPGYHEEKKGEPFVGPAGQKLDQILKAMGLSREEVYLTNLVKFRPAMPNQTTGNRPPTREEIASCAAFIQAEIDIVRPECIIALGTTAAQSLLQSAEKVGDLRGKWHAFRDIPLRVTFHPSYLLHNDEGMAEKRKVWEDMLAVMDLLALPISEKQQSYFLPKK